MVICERQLTISKSSWENLEDKLARKMKDVTPVFPKIFFFSFEGVSEEQRSRSNSRRFCHF